MSCPETIAIDVGRFGSTRVDPAILEALNDSYYGDYLFGGHNWVETIEGTLNYAAFDRCGVVSGLAIVALTGRVSKTQAVERTLMLKCSKILDGTPDGESVQQNLFTEVEQEASEWGITNLQIKVDAGHADFFYRNGFEEIGAGESFGAEYVVLSRKLGTAYGSYEPEVARN